MGYLRIKGIARTRYHMNVNFKFFVFIFPSKFLDTSNLSWKFLKDNFRIVVLN